MGLLLGLNLVVQSLVFKAHIRALTSPLTPRLSNVKADVCPHFVAKNTLRFEARSNYSGKCILGLEAALDEVSDSGEHLQVNQVIQ
jgi:hypothetical protein